MILPALYLALLAASYFQRATHKAGTVTLRPRQQALMVAEIRDGQPTGKDIRIAYFDIPGSDEKDGSLSRWCTAVQEAAMNSIN
jgi:hypothetical protein